MNNTNEKNVKSNNKPVAKVLAVVLAFALMIATSFVVATVVHNRNSVQSVSKVKNGLSAYELAVENGYNGSVQEWLTSLDGKSAYDIAVENGYSGSEKEWANSLKTNAKQEQSDIKAAYFDESGNLIMDLSDGTSIDVGAVAGTDGKNGTNGKDGKDGKDGVDGTNGVDGKNGTDGVNGSSGSNGKDGANGTNGVDGKNGIDGTNGVDGKDGKDGVDGKDGTDGLDGVGISQAKVNSDGELVLTFTDGRIVNLDKVVGAKGEKGDKGDQGEQGLKGDKGDQGEQGLKGDKGDQGEKGTDGTNGTNGVDGKDGKDGVNGTDGADGVGIANVTVASDGVLTVTLTNGTVLNLGNIKGTDGIGITKSEINTSGELVLTYSDGTSANLGKVKGEDGQDGADGRGIQSVSISTDGELIVTYTDSSVVNLGNIKGEKGDKGDQGEQGEKGDAGRGIAKTELVDGELIITYADGTSDNLGDVSSTSSSDNTYLIFGLLSDGTYTVKMKEEYLSTVKGITIPQTYNGKLVTQISESGFKNSVIERIQIPKSVKEIGGDAFDSCTKLKSVYYNGEVSDWIKIAFKANSSANPCANSANLYIGTDYHLLEDVEIPNETVKINPIVFYGCKSIKTINLNNVNVIGKASFMKCSNLESIVIPASVNRIDEKAFYKSGLKNATFEDVEGWSIDGLSSKYTYIEDTRNYDNTIIESNSFEKNIVAETGMSASLLVNGTLTIRIRQTKEIPQFGNPSYSYKTTDYTGNQWLKA